MDMRRSWIATGGWAAVAAGVLLFVSVAAELIHPVQERDGTVVEPVAFAALLVLWGIGALCLAAALRAMQGVHQSAGVSLNRAGRAGIWFGLVGCALHVAFASVGGATALVAERPWEPSFLFFALGFLLLVIGSVLLGIGLRRAGVVPVAAAPVWLGAIAAFAALAVFDDPWHDLALFGFDAAWVAVGFVLLTSDRKAGRGLDAPGAGARSLSR